MSDILTEVKGQPIKLADGNTYMLAPFNLNVLTNLEKEFDCDLEELESKLMKRTASALRTVLWILLKENYPNMTISDAGKLVLIDGMDVLLDLLSKAIEGLKA